MKRLILFFSLLMVFSFANSEEYLGDGWVYVENVSPIDDSSTHVIVKESDDFVFSGISKTKPALGIACYPSGNVELLVSWGVPMDVDFMDSSVEVVTRLDKDKAERKKWDSSNSKVTFYPGRSEEVKNFISSFTGKDKMLVSAKPAFGTTDYAYFSLNGASEAIDTLYDRCYAN